MHGIRLIRALTPTLSELRPGWDEYFARSARTVEGQKEFLLKYSSNAWIEATLERLRALERFQARWMSAVLPP